MMKIIKKDVVMYKIFMTSTKYKRKGIENRRKNRIKID